MKHLTTLLAALLFGQSAMERFGAITIDNQNNKLVIKH